jgi:hypothetical protein
MIPVLLLGFMIGMQHALEVDHVAAVASLATRARTVGSVVRHGALWGLGHTLTLLVVGALLVLLGSAVPEWMATLLNLAVGAILLLLGLDVLRRLWRDRIHFHRHRHADGVAHLHAHSHAGETAPHDPRRHHHEHPERLPLRTLAVGMMHGLAGSAALLILALASVQSAATALLYIAVFGLGSIVGMAALSAVIAIPLSYSAGFITWAHRGMQAGIGLATIAVGAWIVFASLTPAA